MNPSTFYFRAEGHEASALSFLKDRKELAHVDLDFLFRFGAIYANGKRFISDQPIDETFVMRVHTAPKRYPLPMNISSLIISEDENLVVINKPSGLPTHATLDNKVENAQAYLSENLKIPILTTHRLDIDTSGVLVFAKTPRSQAHINSLFEKRKVKKEYTAVTSQFVAPGKYSHWMKKTKGSPKILLESPSEENLLECSLTVLACEKKMTEKFVVRISLQTGRTHQIRAQLNALGSPILGDSIYNSEFGPAANTPKERLHLHCSKLCLALKTFEAQADFI